MKEKVRARDTSDVAVAVVFGLAVRSGGGEGEGIGGGGGEPFDNAIIVDSCLFSISSSFSAGGVICEDDGEGQSFDNGNVMV